MSICEVFFWFRCFLLGMLLGEENTSGVKGSVKNTNRLKG